MRSFEIFLHPEAEMVTPQRRRQEARSTRALLDVFVRGANVTARVGDGQALSALVDVATATLFLATRPSAKKIVYFHDEACELCIERDGARAYLSVYRTSALPEVYVYDRALPFADIVHGVRESVARVLAHEAAPRQDADASRDDMPPRSGVVVKPEKRSANAALCAELSALLERFDQLPEIPADDEEDEMPARTVSVEAPRGSVGFHAELALRARDIEHDRAHAEFSDFHALLVPGSVRAVFAGRSVNLGGLHPFLFAETLLTLASRLFEAWQRGRAAHERLDASRYSGSLDAGLTLGARLTGDRLALVLSSRGATQTYPGLSLLDFAEGILAFGSGLVRALLRHDRSQNKNLRLAAFRRRLRELREALHDVAPSDLKINGAPESYRAYVAGASEPAYTSGTPKPAKAVTRTPARLRYETAWRAVVPGIELASTFLCGSRLIVGSHNEIYCLDRDSGAVQWNRPVLRGASVVTPEGLVRIGLDGSLAMHDWESGEVALRTWTAPRAFGPPTGVVASGPGLPRLLILTEGERHLLAIDLRTGDARWRTSWRSARTSSVHDNGPLRLRRHGKLLYVTTGDSALTALDVVTGQIVWRTRDHLRFCGAPNIAQHDGFALAGGQVGKARLHAFDPYSGESRWISELSGQYASTEGNVLTGKGGPVMVVRRERTGLLVEGFDRDDGRSLWQTPVLAPSGTAWLVVDGRLVGNTPHGELIGVCSQTGKTVYRTRFGRIPESDIPRRLEPVLRSGALFVPHADVQVVRPEDGSVISSVGAKDTIPDLMRIDERCSVFTAEESGHLAAYQARARLSLVS